MERQTDLMLYVTRTRFLNGMIGRYNEYSHIRLGVCFVISLRLLLTFYAKWSIFLCESQHAVSANSEVQASRRGCTD